MQHNTQVLRIAIASGKSLEAGLEQLREMGVTPVEAIKAIREAKCVGLGEAKQIFSQTPASTRDAQAVHVLHDEIISLLEAQDKRS